MKCVDLYGGEEVNTHDKNNGGGTINPELSFENNPSLEEDYHQQQTDDSRDLENKREWRGFDSSQQRRKRIQFLKQRWRVKIKRYENLRENQKIRRIVREGEMIFFVDLGKKKRKDSQRTVGIT